MTGDRKPVAEAIRKCFNQILEQHGDELARRCATETIEAATVFLIHANCPVAARAALLVGVTALDRELAHGNANSEYLQ